MTRHPLRSAGLVAISLALIALLLPWPGPVAGLLRERATSARPTLPAQFAPYSRLTASALDRPAGRAIALYEYGSSELFTTWQTLVVGADRDTYRQLDTTEQALLSPDGTQVLSHGVGQHAFVLLNLVTGATRVVPTVPWMSNVGGDAQLLDWSGDGRYVAYAVPAPPPADGTAANSFREERVIEELAILDLSHDSSTRYPQISPVWGAVFGPSGDQVLVQLVREGELVSVDGEILGPVQLPTGAELSWGAKFSRDGTLVATPVAHVAAPPTVGFVDLRTKRPLDQELAVSEFLGWRTPTSVLSHERVPELDADAIVDVSMVDGHTTVLSTFSRAKSCEYGLQRCNPYRIHLATNLIGAVPVRPSDPDRGPGPHIVRITWAVMGALVAGLLTLLALRLARRRRA